MIEVISIPTFSDNYVWLIKNTSNNHCCIIDPGQAAPVIDVIAQQGLILESILITHHHYDHIDGISELLTSTNDSVFIYSSVAMPQYDNLIIVDDQDKLSLLKDTLKLNVMATPGHKREHVIYHNDTYAFTGDTLFSGGCGRILDGTACELFHSLQKISQLDDTILVYPAHEYTQANLMFCHAVESHNTDLKLAIADVAKRRQLGLSSLPSTIKKEKQINVFLRAHEPMIRAVLEDKHHQLFNSELVVFTALRAWKDHF